MKKMEDGFERVAYFCYSQFGIKRTVTIIILRMMVTEMNKVYALISAMLIAPNLLAKDVVSANSTAATSKTWYVGAGITQKLLHLNAEWVNPYGIVYAKAGAFMGADHQPGGQIGFRTPVHLTAKDNNGYYIGAYAGHIDRHWVDGDDEARLGGGIDLAYVMLSKERSSTFSVGIGAGEKLQDRSGRVIAETEPRLQFSYTLSVGL